MARVSPFALVVFQPFNEKTFHKKPINAVRSATTAKHATNSVGSVAESPVASLLKERFIGQVCQWNTQEALPMK